MQTPPAPPAPAPTPTTANPTPPAPATAFTARLIIAIVLGAAVALLGGFILGEYPFTGFMPYAAGVLFAMVVTEVITSISHQHGRITAVAAAACSVGGLGVAIRISSGDGLAPIPIGAWVALVIGLVVALLAGGITGGVRRRGSSPR